MVVRERFEKAKQSAEDFVVSTLEKYGFGTFGRSGYETQDKYEPIYERTYSPQWIRSIAKQQSLVNNSIEEKVQQAFRRGFDDWEKRYAAKCPNCKEEFHSAERFKEQIGQSGSEMSLHDIDFESNRICPECEEMVNFTTPSTQRRDLAQTFFNKANARDKDDVISTDRHASVSQSFLQICQEVARDIQTFDDGWMIFEKAYTLDEEGNVEDWMPQGVFRTPPQKTRYSVDEHGKFGNEYWVCLKCRSQNPEEYQAQKEPGPCRHCENRTYECFAYILDQPQGEPTDWFIQGEFAHDSEYWPSRLYGLSPIVSIADEAQSLTHMDDWYRSAYEERRAPRGAIVLGSQNNQSVRSWTKEQTQKLNNDPKHIPVFMNDNDSSGKPIEWIKLLDDPTDMQNMQMREWFLDRIAAKFGVTQVFQNASAQTTGMSQSMEILVSNRSAQRLQRVFEDTFIPAFLDFLQADGWERHLLSPEEEDDSAIEQMMGRRLKNVQSAYDLGLEVEWTKEDDYDIKPTTLKPDEGDEDDGGGGVGSMFGPAPHGGNGGGGGSSSNSGDSDDSDNNPQSNPSDDRVTTDEGVDSAGTTTTEGGRPEDANTQGGAPDEPDTPTTEDPIRRGDGAVTTDTGGFSNPTYSGKPGQVIDVMRDIRDSEEEDDKMQKVQKLRRKYNECVEAADNELPTYEQIERSVIQRPDKNFNGFKRNSNKPWVQSVEAIMFVEKVYEFIEETTQ